jgi:hypothetical protein
LIAPEPRHAHRRAEFPGFCLLLARNREGALEIRFGFRRVRLRRLEQDFRRHSIDLGYTLFFGEASSDYILIKPNNSDLCILAIGDIGSVNMRESWFALIDATND